ncbi:MAG: tetratricopeptide repeat protein [Acidobacteriota bacterium]
MTDPTTIAPHERLGPWSLMALAAVAFGLRALYFADARSFALFDVPLADGRAYLDWARRISAGDLWSIEVGAFYQAPLYPYLLAAVQTLAGEAGEPAARTLAAARWLQAGFGTLACLLLAVAGCRLFDRSSGLAAGLLLAIYPPAIYFDGILGKTSLAQLLFCLVLALLTVLVATSEPHAGRERRSSSRPGVALALGVALGLLALVRENALLLAPLLGVWAATDGSLGHRSVRRSLTIAFAVGVLAILLPVALRNQAVSGSFALTTSQSGPNFFIGNRAGASGTYAPLRVGRSDPRFERADAIALAEAASGRSLSAAEVSRYWWRSAGRDIAADPLSWIRLLGRKTVLTIHRTELPDVEDFRLFAERIRLLRWLAPWLHFGVLAPLAAAGMVVTWKRRRSLLPFYLCVVGLGLGVVAFYVFGRYRFPLVPLAALFAGAALVATGRGLGRGTRRPPAPALVAGVAVALLAHLPLPWLLATDPSRAEAGRAMGYVNLGAALVDQGRLDEALEEYQRALALDDALLEARLNLGSLLVVTGKPEKGRQHLEAAAALSPGDPEVQHQLGQAWREIARVRGRREALERSRIHLERAIELDLDFARAAFDLAIVLDWLGDAEAAEERLAEARRAAERIGDRKLLQEIRAHAADRATR